jgi:membrane protease YdiL (CAAX protease family)
MDIAEGLAYPKTGDTPPKQRAGYYYVIKSFVIWVLLVFAANFVAAFLVAFVYAFVTRLGTGQAKPPPAEWMYLLAMATTSLVWLTASYRRTGFDRVRLGFNPIKRQWLLVVLSLVVLIYLPVVLWVSVANQVHTPVLPTARALMQTNLWMQIPVLVLMAAVAPIAEECLFRGWLWTDLRQYWSGAGTMVFTGRAFWAIHGLEDWHRLYGIALLALVLTLARRFCDSTKATLWLHSLNNSYAALVLLLASHTTVLDSVVRFLQHQ